MAQKIGLIVQILSRKFNDFKDPKMNFPIGVLNCDFLLILLRYIQRNVTSTQRMRNVHFVLCILPM
jgi:hypothetical protein